jgi:hypothetical protein
MKNKTTLTVIAVAALASANLAQADTINGSLGTAASATDWYTVNCPTGTAKAYADIVDTSAADSVFPSILLSKTGAISTSDNPEGGAASAGVTLSNNNGVYNIYITHSGATAAANNYTANVHCQTSTGAHVGGQPAFVTKQNQ